MYPFDRDVVVRDGQGQSYTFKLLDIIDERYLVLIEKEHEEALTRLEATPELSDEEVDLLYDEAFVIDGEAGLIMVDSHAAPVVQRSHHYALRLAGARWEEELPDLDVAWLDESDLALAFDLEVAKRRRHPHD
ncbi:MAG TPA: hypothetical protein V6D05_00085 [Stenomitos sp.]